MTLIDLIKQHEGLRLTPYRCTEGKMTIGWGHNLDAHGEIAPDIITVSQADEYLQADIYRALAGCKSVIPNFDHLDEVRQAALIDMCFNIGPASLSQFKTMIAALGRGDWIRVAVSMIDSKWARQVPSRVLGLVKLMLIGEW